DTPIETIDSSELAIMETNGIKHIIPLDKIKGGGPPKGFLKDQTDSLIGLQDRKLCLMRTRS
ncbi:MAG: hypothetical protein OPY08_03375, partial [Nitrosopumilus sp.]|nr:hypothetical protein [Nitrosopumilus sp.]